MNSKLTLGLLLALSATPALAQSNNDVTVERSGEVGIAIAKGNTDTQTAFGKLNYKREEPVYLYTAGAAALYGKSNSVANARRLTAFGTMGRKLDERTYFFGNVRLERDDFSAFDYQAVVGAGIGRKFIDNATTKLIGEIGPGYRRSRLADSSITRNEAIARGLLTFSHKLNDNVSLYNDLLVEAGKYDKFVQDGAGVAVKMTDNVSLKAGIDLRYHSDVLPGTKKTDTLTTLNLQFGF